MPENADSFARYFSTIKAKSGFRFVFYCELCGRQYETKTITKTSYYEALAEARSSARLHFNKCRECGRWVCDRHYDANSMRCSLCSSGNPDVSCPKPPRSICKCASCGNVIESGDCFCKHCGKAVQKNNTFI